MLGKNKGICHSCKRSGHYLQACPTKKRFSVCGEGFVKWMEVEKKSENIRRPFFCCSTNCGYFKWSNDIGESSGDYDVGESSDVSSSRNTAKDEIVNLSRIFKIFSQIFEQEDVEISVSVTISKGKGTTEENSKGKDKTKMN
ncbi:Zinc finger protein [Abeliophyllum distichum]|uniref:Zinc finger protein n=1 Tax=Abeliophyllum distichum TaxID=126358 RepID=A0ABD1V4Q3_9LAMI